MAGVEFGGNRGETDRQIVDAAVFQRAFQLLGEMAAANKAGAGQADIEVAEHVADIETTRPGLQAVELAGGITAADHGADRGSNDDVRNNAARGECAHHADMGKAARRAAAEREPDGRPRGGRPQSLGGGVGGTVAIAHACE